MLVRARRRPYLRTRSGTTNHREGQVDPERMMTAQSRQKSYHDKRRKDLEFEVGDHVFLRVTPWTGVGRALKSRKFAPLIIGPFQILKRFGL